MAPSGLISVIWQEVEGSFAVGGAGVGAGANGVEAGMAEHASDGDQVDAAARAVGPATYTTPETRPSPVHDPATAQVAVTSA